jgi:alanine dehydrogenase
MRIITRDDVNAVLTPQALIARLKMAFQSEAIIPPRHHHSFNDATLLLMPAFGFGYMGTKIVSVFPQNASKNLPAVQGQYLLQSGETGEALALIDGKSLTSKRTAAASALASSYLSRENSETLLMIGAGALAPDLIQAHSTVRPISRVLQWNRTWREGFVRDLDEAIAEADIISCATLSKIPLIKRKHVKPGTHIDLVGGFTPEMREADDDMILNSTLFCDTFAGVLHEAGDFTQNNITRENIHADLAMLCKGEHKGRASMNEITLFKSVGTALEDLAAAMLVYNALSRSHPA